MDCTHALLFLHHTYYSPVYTRAHTQPQILTVESLLQFVWVESNVTSLSVIVWGKMKENKQKLITWLIFCRELGSNNHITCRLISFDNSVRDSHCSIRLLIFCSVAFRQSLKYVLKMSESCLLLHMQSINKLLIQINVS